MLCFQLCTAIDLSSIILSDKLVNPQFLDVGAKWVPTENWLVVCIFKYRPTVHMRGPRGLKFHTQVPEPKKTRVPNKKIKIEIENLDIF